MFFIDDTKGGISPLCEKWKDKIKLTTEVFPSELQSTDIHKIKKQNRPNKWKKEKET